jgi:enoyl-CoA hydratase/3-hydroxyacyl-CoA dehydrogenase
MSSPFDHEYETIRVAEVASGVAHLQLDRRSDLNAITETVLVELSDAVEALGRDGEVQVLVLSGAGPRAVSVGAAARDRLDHLDMEAAVELSRRGQRAFARVRQFPGPVIASIEGYCLGGGMELAACADLRIAAPGAAFGQPELDLGLVPGWGGTQRLGRLIGTGRAMEVILTADEYDAQTMARYGFVNWIAEEPFDAACARATSLAEHSRVAQQYAKRAVEYGGDQTGVWFEALAFGHAADRFGESDDGSE